tara:strand:- start:2016 stop:2561 length:546 start_codon:yes stop_codon:yes gene_type:complete
MDSRKLKAIAEELHALDKTVNDYHTRKRWLLDEIVRLARNRPCPEEKKIQIDIEIPPAPRPRVMRTGITYYPKTYRDFKTKGAFLLRQAWKGETLTGALRIEIVFLIKKPKSKIRKLTKNDRLPCYKTRGDIDNRIKSLFDILQDAGVIQNDSQIYSIQADCWFAGVDEEIVTSIYLSEIL